MSWYQKRYVPVAERRRKAEKKITAMLKKGETVQPVSAATPRGKIADSYWGLAWCDHLESYSDYANRLPRGRSYLRNGSVLHVGIETGRINALVMGSELYKQSVHIAPLPKAKWENLKKRCQGKIGSLVELLQGKLSNEIMAVVTDRTHGLFPSPNEIKLDCSCPDWADLCKHLAAVLYGVGARLDQAPELLFTLRGVDYTELIQTDTASLVSGTGTRRRLAPAVLGEVFDIELDDDAAAIPDTRKPDGTKPKTKKQYQARAKGRSSATITPVRVPFEPTAEAVRRLRKDLGLTRNAFAKKLGVSAPTVSNWEAKSGPLTLHARSLLALERLNKTI